MRDFIKEYLALRNDIDIKSAELEKTHANELACKPGCSSCCENIKIFDIEFDAIQFLLKQKGKLLPPNLIFQKYRSACRFLVHNQCSIYEERPIICRTHGLPILYRSTMGTHYELSVCKLNFKGVEPQTFNETNALMMSPLNSKLFLLNKEYIEFSKPERKNKSPLINLHELKIN